MQREAQRGDLMAVIPGAPVPKAVCVTHPLPTSNMAAAAKPDVAVAVAVAAALCAACAADTRRRNDRNRAWPHGQRRVLLPRGSSRSRTRLSDGPVRPRFTSGLMPRLPQVLELPGSAHSYRTPRRTSARHFATRLRQVCAAASVQPPVLVDLFVPAEDPGMPQH